MTTHALLPAHGSTVTEGPVMQLSPAALDSLMSALEARFVALSECFVSPGFRLSLGGVDAPGIHYNLTGTGVIRIGSLPPIALSPHTLIVVPPSTPFSIEVSRERVMALSMKAIDGRTQTAANGMIRRFVAGDVDNPEIILICGYFHAVYGSSIDLFASLATPIVEQFDAVDGLDIQLKSALAELRAPQVGMGAMAAALLKQVMIALLRRTLKSSSVWVECISMLSDPQIARAFSQMVAQPGSSHTTQTLAELACLSRSAFMARFTHLFGRSPMLVLRELRMRQAAVQLEGTKLSVDRIARNVGYTSRSSFVRAFRKSSGFDPSDYRVRGHSSPSETFDAA